MLSVLKEWIRRRFGKPEDENLLFEMANLRQADTGLPMVIWVSEKGHARHDPCVKVCKIHSHKADIQNAVSVSISDNPHITAGSGLTGKDFDQVKEYIRLNKTVLLDYWFGEIGTGDLIRNLKKL